MSTPKKYYLIKCVLGKNVQGTVSDGWSDDRSCIAVDLREGSGNTEFMTMDEILGEGSEDAQLKTMEEIVSSGGSGELKIKTTENTPPMTCRVIQFDRDNSLRR